MSPAPQLAPEPAPAPVVAAQAPTTPRRPASLPAVPNASLTPEVAITADLRLRLKSVNAGAARREPARFTPSRAVWSAGGVLAAGALAALVWSAGSALGLRRAPALLEAKGSLNMLPVWPFPATVVAASPGASATRPPQSVAASPTSPFRDNASNATVNARLPAASASLLAPETDASRVESAWPASNPAGNVVPAPPVPAGALRVETAPATTPLAAAEPPAVAAPSPVASPAAGRRAGAVGAGRGQAFRRETFSAGDADVAPPDLRRQQLPTAVLEPGTAVPEGWPYLMLVVDETGVVESVRLTARIPPPGQSLYRHRMLVSAAKAWQFEPARKNGQPVRYAIRVPLEP